MSLRVVIVQHGDKERLPGDPGLTELGLTQALATARSLGRGDVPVGIWTSPMRRARETAIPIADELGVPPTSDVRLRERMNWGDSIEESIEDFLQDWRTASADRAYVPRSGDSSFEAASRFLEVLDDLAASYPSGTAIVVAHGGVTTDVLRTLLGDDELCAKAPALIDDGVPSCAITTLHASRDGWAVASIAVADHLDDERATRPDTPGALQTGRSERTSGARSNVKDQVNPERVKDQPCLRQGREGAREAGQVKPAPARSGAHLARRPSVGESGGRTGGRPMGPDLAVRERVRRAQPARAGQTRPRLSHRQATASGNQCARVVTRSGMDMARPLCPEDGSGDSRRTNPYGDA
jgi:broad specificity phosphatase PhoE